MHRILSVVSSLLLVPAALVAQEPRPPVGTRVRLKTLQLAGRDAGKTHELRGTIAEWRGDTLVLRTNKALLTDVPLSTASDFSVARGRGPNPIGGAIKGAAFGAGVGFTLLAIACGEADEDLGPGTSDDDSCTLSDFGNIMLVTAGLAVAGGALGIVVGTVVGAERWRPLAIGRARLSVRSPGGGLGVGVSLSF